jgi:hypothetical protein
MSSFCASQVLAFAGPITFSSNLVNAGSMLGAHLLTSFNYPTLRVTTLGVNGSTLVGSVCTTVNIDWANSTYTGAGTCISLNYLNLSITELNRILTTLPTVTGKTINIQNCTGSAGCTPAIATAKGWTVVR